MVYHPQTNGLIERLNKTLANIIPMYVDVEHKILPYFSFTYYTAVQETTGFTPFRLHHFASSTIAMLYSCSTECCPMSLMKRTTRKLTLHCGLKVLGN